MSFIDIYNKALETAQEIEIKSSNFSSKPIMNKGVISPESTIQIQPVWGIEFELDIRGMEKVLALFEKRWANKDENERKNLIVLLLDVYAVSEEYLGGHGIKDVRQKAYLNATDNRLRLSEIEGKNIGMCAERATIGHQIISILFQAGITNYVSFLTNSHITTKSREPHSFIILQHKDDLTKSFLFDIENPIEFRKKDSDKKLLGLALYPMTEQEFKDFKDGRNISPESIYEKMGMSIIGEKRFYGDESVQKEEEK